MSTRSDPRVVRLDARTLQTVRGAFNAVIAYVEKYDKPVKQVFDPARLEILKEINDGFANVQATLAEDGSGEVTLNPSMRETARDAIAAIEDLVTTAAGQEQLDDLGANYNREDLSMLKNAIDRIEPVRNADDLAATDITYPLYTEVFPRKYNRVLERAIAADYPWEKPNRPDHGVAEDGYPSFSVCTQVDGGGNALYAGFQTLAIHMAKAVDANRSARIKTADAARDAIDEFEFRMQDNKCYTKPDRRRMVLSAKKAARIIEQSGEAFAVRTMHDMAIWTEYRVRNGLVGFR